MATIDPGRSQCLADLGMHLPARHWDIICYHLALRMSWIFEFTGPFSLLRPFIVQLNLNWPQVANDVIAKNDLHIVVELAKLVDLEATAQ